MAQGKKISEQTWDKFAELYAGEMASINAVTRALNISPKSYYRKLQEDESFRERIISIEEGIKIPLVENALYKAALLEGHVGAMKHILTMRGGERWSLALQNDKYYQHWKNEQSKQQYVPDDPMTLLFHEMFYMPIYKKSIGYEYANGEGKGKEFIEKECRDLIEGFKEYRQHLQNKRKLEQTKKRNKKYIEKKVKKDK